MRSLLPRTGLMILLAAFAVRAAAEMESDVWTHDFERAEADARAQGRPLILHFHAKWCGPCKEMDAEVLHDALLMKQLRTGFVAVKIDGDERPDLVRRFEIKSYPSDLFLDPNGFVLERSERRRDRQAYLALVARIDSRFAQFRKAQIASQTTPISTPPPASMAAASPADRRALVAPSPIGGRPPGHQDAGAAAVLAARAPQSPHAGPQTVVKKTAPPVGLRGYSPVALVQHRRWTRGSDKLAWEYKGIVYFMSTPEELQYFKASPDHYAPQVLGCDPVILDISDRAVTGDIRYAAFFESDLFLFVSEKSRQTFRQDPERYVRTKHVLKVDELDDKRLR